MSDINNLTVANSIFNGNSSVIRNVYKAPKEIDYEKIEKELREIKANLKDGSSEYQVVETLEKGSKTQNWSAICTAIGQFSSQFASATLANLAGCYLSRLFGLGY